MYHCVILFWSRRKIVRNDLREKKNPLITIDYIVPHVNRLLAPTALVNMKTCLVIPASLNNRCRLASLEQAVGSCPFWGIVCMHHSSWVGAWKPAQCHCHAMSHGLALQRSVKYSTSFHSSCFADSPKHRRAVGWIVVAFIILHHERDFPSSCIMQLF